jgi:hypothetical protein
MLNRNHAGEFIFHYIDDTDEVISAIKEICSYTKIGKQFAEGDYVDQNGADGYETIVRAAVKVANGPMISAGSLERALTLLIDSGELKPKKFTPAAQLSEPEEDTRPRDKNGKLLTAAQIKWSSFSRFANTASMEEVNRRKASDPEFRQFVAASLRGEMLPAEDGVEPAGQSKTKARVSAELIEFARKYTKEPIENLRPKGGFVKLEGEQISWNDFQNLLYKASAAGVIR